ncbi:hypothetical protein H0H81_008060 [Sphagnurus paluster]|uniref:Mediator of RNA polymerase II transcription subunit 6 n=1 Tax=Sphagnurus paluster TaxID=117069 RepID=A0A9P7KLC2_9AGAR|nr:hypothetical protein H0H81_008060 [Sphagnurus paluster]
MDINDLHPQDDYSHRFFIWHEWIQANGPLTSENVFDYFATSMFYDKQSNNQVLRMQTIHSGLPIENETEELKRFTGIEFAVVHSQPPSMFIIHKRERLSPDEGSCIVAPMSVQLTSLHSLQTSLDILRSHRPDYTPRTGFVWPITDPMLPAEITKKRSADAEDSVVDSDDTRKPASASEPPKRQQNNLLLLNAMRATAAHSKMSLASSTFAAAAAAAENAPAETPVTYARSSATPGPSASQAATPKTVQSAPTPQEPTRGPAGAGKKKRKRMSGVYSFEVQETVYSQVFSRNFACSTVGNQLV